MENTYLRQINDAEPSSYIEVYETSSKIHDSVFNSVYSNTDISAKNDIYANGEKIDFSNYVKTEDVKKIKVDNSTSADYALTSKKIKVLSGGDIFDYQIEIVNEMPISPVDGKIYFVVE